MKHVPSYKYLGAIVLLLHFFVLNIKVSAETWEKIKTGNNFAVLKNTENGIFIGEFDQRSGNSSYNGITQSQDLGVTWINKGLQGKGVTNISSNSKWLLATTYFVRDVITGLFMSQDMGVTWVHKGPVFSASAVAINANTVYLGAYSNGLWVSNDEGDTWVQKIGTGWFGPNVQAIEIIDDIVFVGSVGKSYKSTDNGNTWTEIVALNGKTFKYFCKHLNYIYAGTQDNDGLYLSKNKGVTWEKINSFGTSSILGLSSYNNCIYAGKKETTANRVLKSCDKGLTWNSTSLATTAASNNIGGLSSLYAQNGYLLGTVQNEGIYKMNIENPPLEYFKFLNTPFDLSENRTNVDYIASYFDHDSPLLGYNYYKETPDQKNTTVTYTGEKATKPAIYYSSHSGIDYALPYATDIKAPADGVARYYYCGDCGNSIKINHLNGYQSVYMHLQNNGLITKSQPKTVFKGEVLGKVGMTGNTTGPHLHLELQKDVNNNNNFDDDFPWGRVDPYGWLNIFLPDPWPNFTWQDALGFHQGTLSKYLWLDTLHQEQKLITTNNIMLPITIGNKTIDIKSISAPLPFNIFATPGNMPRTIAGQNPLNYVKNTSLIIEAMDTLGNKIHTLNGTVQIIFDLSEIILSKMDTATLSAYTFDEILNTWRILPSQWNPQTKTLTAETTHLSKFAVFGNTLDNVAPKTLINIAGTLGTNAYVNTPIITLATEDSTDKIFYSIVDDLWEEYQTPVTLSQDGTYFFKFRSMDTNNNLEETNQILIKVNTGKKFMKTVKVTSAMFSTILANNTAP